MPTMLFTALQNYAGFSGRARRKEYWQFILLTLILGVVAGIIDAVLGLDGPDMAGGVFGGLVNLALLIPTLAVGWRRMHDVNKSGWINLLPLLGVVLLVAGFGSQFAALASGTMPTGFTSGPLVWFGVAVLAATTIYVFVLTVTEGTRGSNDYGPDPKGFSGDRLQDVFR